MIKQQKSDEKYERILYNISQQRFAVGEAQQCIIYMRPWLDTAACPRMGWKNVHQSDGQVQQRMGQVLGKGR